MPFPTTAPLSRVLSDTQVAAGQLKTYCQGFTAASLAGPLSANAVLDLLWKLVQCKAAFDAAAATPGIGPWAQDQLGNPSLDIAAEFAAMTAAVVTVRDWIIANFPAAGGYIQKDQLTVSGVTVRQFSTADLAGLRDQLAALIATIG